jgi:hypothetical protein
MKHTFNKALLIPVISALAVVVKHATGYEVPGELTNAIADLTLAGIAIAGIFMKPKKEKK